VVPAPSRLSTWRNPPCLRTQRLTMGRPSPVPDSSGFVVKKGAKTCSLRDSGMPLPVSATEMHTYSPSGTGTPSNDTFPSEANGPEEMVNRPPRGMASPAFTPR